LRVPWTARRSNQSILKEIGPEYSLEGLMLKLKLQYCGHLMQRTDSSEKTLLLGKIEGKRSGKEDKKLDKQRTLLAQGLVCAKSWTCELFFASVQFSSVAQLCPTLCDPMDCSTSGLPVHHQLLEFTQTHIHRVGDAIQPSHPLSSPSPPAFNLSQQQRLFR